MTEETQRQFSIQRIYTKDISFETPNSPEVFMQEWKPQINVNLNNAIKDLGEGNIEVALTVTVTAKIEDKTAFLAEVTQAGIFLAQGIPEEEMGPLLGIYCPNTLFPYVREVVSDLIVRGSFPQFLLAPVNFEALYAQQVQQQKQAEESAEH
ncbi:protein-export chaperone SecB [Thiolapillus brandeum]|uniref:Protein-export protein SecB n=1 Tax=Thiolapillus brandeum TaxID=1076588 RepID=A0A7U6JH02_9GAMM|nr:protein-export chaperone SecB [Thiolapillus brandeum]BAO43283.1 preprotein translocase subunit SecB [Thiolapillus brandeum]